MTRNSVTLVQDHLLSSGLLTPENNVEIQRLNAELTDAWGKRQVFRTEFEMRISVLNDGKFPTRAAKYWQAVREQANMLDNLAVVGFDHRRNELQIRRLEAKLMTESDPFEIESLNIDLDECLFKRAGMQQNANDRMREIREWSVLKAEQDDGSFDVKDPNTHQLESMRLSLRNRHAALAHSNSSQAEVSNVIGPLATAERVAKERALAGATQMRQTVSQALAHTPGTSFEDEAIKAPQAVRL